MFRLKYLLFVPVLLLFYNTDYRIEYFLLFLLIFNEFAKIKK